MEGCPDPDATKNYASKMFDSVPVECCPEQGPKSGFDSTVHRTHCSRNPKDQVAAFRQNLDNHSCVSYGDVASVFQLRDHL